VTTVENNTYISVAVFVVDNCRVSDFWLLWNIDIIIRGLVMTSPLVLPFFLLQFALSVEDLVGKCRV
jgi:hypothetical protein